MLFPRPLAATGAAVVVAIVALPAVASAHVSIPEPAPRGGFSVVTFSVPNERDDAGTVTFEVQMPREHPLGSVRPQPKPGWTVETTTRALDQPIELFGEERTEVVDTVAWTGGTIEPGQFDTFTLSVGPLPDDVDRIEFPAIQTYSSGEEVAWIESTPEGGEEPELPAPVLTLVDVTDRAAPAGQEHGAVADGASPEQATGEGRAAGNDGVDALAVAALVVAVVAALLGAAALATARRGTS